MLNFASSKQNNKFNQLKKERKRIMASMSYCVIENTSSDMWACVEKFTERQNALQDNQYEMARLESLYNACKRFVAEYEEYLEDRETYIAEHSEPEDEDDEY